MNRLRRQELTTIVAFADLASGKKIALKRVRARSAIIVLGQDQASHLFVLLAWADRVAAERMMEKIFEVNRNWRPSIFGVDATSMQSMYSQMLRREARLRQLHLPLREVSAKSTQDKIWKIRTTLQPVIADGRLFVQPQQYELKKEISTFPMAPTLDLVDALSECIKLIPRVSSQRERDHEHEAHLAYLRESGASPAYIEQVAAGVA